MKNLVHILCLVAFSLPALVIADRLLDSAEAAAACTPLAAGNRNCRGIGPVVDGGEPGASQALNSPASPAMSPATAMEANEDVQPAAAVRITPAAADSRSNSAGHESRPSVTVLS
jgi:hypothetical protein